MKLFKTISVFVLAFLVLVSSSSFLVGIHRCAGKVQNVAIFTKAEGCEMEKKLPPCHRHKAAPCCEDETILHEADAFKAAVVDITLSPAPVLDFELPLVILSEVIPSSSISRTQFYNYDPPLRSYDITVSNQVFLI